MADMMYHLFFESRDEGIGYYIGSCKNKDDAKKIGEWVCDFFDEFGYYVDKPQEFRKIIKSWRHYKIFPETESTLLSFYKSIVFSLSGMTNALAIKSNAPDFVKKYIEYRGTTQLELFPKQPYEYRVMFQYELKRQIAQKKLIRRHEELETKNFILVNVNKIRSDEEDVNFDDIKSFFRKKIEVTKNFFDEMEYTDFISIGLDNENIKNEIVEFDNYFRNDVVLKARGYDEVANILFFDLVDIQC